LVKSLFFSIALLKKNMRFAKPDATEGEIIQALKDANAYDFIKNKMTKGIHTMVGGSGGSLSGG
jgi:ABC-type multidrug transport system fused ATPase/permease subunit